MPRPSGLNLAPPAAQWATMFGKTLAPLVPLSPTPSNQVMSARWSACLSSTPTTLDSPQPSSCSPASLCHTAATWAGSRSLPATSPATAPAACLLRIVIRPSPTPIKLRTLACCRFARTTLLAGRSSAGFHPPSTGRASLQHVMIHLRSEKKT